MNSVGQWMTRGLWEEPFSVFVVRFVLWFACCCFWFFLKCFSRKTVTQHFQCGKVTRFSLSSLQKNSVPLEKVENIFMSINPLILKNSSSNTVNKLNSGAILVLRVFEVSKQPILKPCSFLLISLSWRQLTGRVVRTPGLKSRGPGFKSR